MAAIFQIVKNQFKRENIIILVIMALLFFILLPWMISVCPILYPYIVYLIPLLIVLIYFLVTNLLKSNSIFDSCFIVFTAIVLLLIGISFINKILLAPFSMWNGFRLAWSFSLKYGYQIYYGPDTGPLLCRMYGPLTALAFLPVTLLNTPTLAVILASFINACFYFLPILWLYIGRNHLHPKRLLPTLYFFILFYLFTICSGALKYSAFNIHSDAPALGLGAIACAILYHRRSKNSNLSLLLSAFFAVCSVWTKQTMLPILLALSVYILLADGQQCFRRYILYICIVAGLITLIFLKIFNAHDLFFNMIAIPTSEPPKFGNWIVGFFRLSLRLIKESFIFAVILILYSRHQLLALPKSPNKLKTWFNSNPWTMLVIVGFFMVPTSLVGATKTMAADNTLSLTLYFLAVSAVIVSIEFFSDLLSLPARIPGKTMKIFFILIIVATAIYIKSEKLAILENIQNINNLSHNPQQLSYEFIKKHPGQAYFPDNILSSLLAEGKLYNSVDGMLDRKLSGFLVRPEHFRAFIPKKINMVVLHKSYQWRHSYILDYLPEFLKQVQIDELPYWIVYVRE